jgi:hypothetical protein
MFSSISIDFILTVAYRLVTLPFNRGAARYSLNTLLDA